MLGSACSDTLFFMQAGKAAAERGMRFPTFSNWLIKPIPGSHKLPSSPRHHPCLAQFQFVISGISMHR